MKFAIQNLLSWREWQSHPEVYANSLEECRLADELGFHAVWLAEHHFSPYGICPNLAVFGAAVARETKRVRIGTAVVIEPFSHPVRIAEEFAMLDILSGGRLDFGIGRGYQPKEFTGLGVSMERTRERFEEGDKAGRGRRAPGRGGPEVLGERRRVGRPAGAHSRALTACPPNWLRRAASILSAKIWHASDNRPALNAWNPLSISRRMSALPVGR